MKKKVIISAAPLLAAMKDSKNRLRPAIDILESAGLELTTFPKSPTALSPAEFEAAMAGVQGAIVSVEPWGEEQFAASKDLKILSRYGVGFDAVDVAAAKRHNIMATNTRLIELSNGVAELSLALTFAVYRHVAERCAELKGGKWAISIGRQIKGRTVGIVGFGAIGQCFARLLLGFGARVIACDPYPNMAVAKELGVEIVPFDEVLASSDIVSLSAPNTPENRHLFNAATFAKMRDGSVFINTARGAMVDEKALCDALTSGKLFGAGIDVWEQEPTPTDNPLLKAPNLVCLPHVAGHTEESSFAMAEMTAKQVVAALSGEKPINLLTE